MHSHLYGINVCTSVQLNTPEEVYAGETWNWPIPPGSVLHGLLRPGETSKLKVMCHSCTLSLFLVHSDVHSHLHGMNCMHCMHCMHGVIIMCFSSTLDGIPASVVDPVFGKGGFMCMYTVATTPPFDAHAHRCNESGCCCVLTASNCSLLANYTSSSKGISMETLWICHCQHF